MKSRRAIPPAAALLVCFLLLTSAIAQTPVDFTRQIEPLFASRCVQCHGPDKQKGGLRLDSKTDALRGGDSGKVIVPAKSSESKLIHLVSGADPEMIMPQKGERLATHEIALLRTWIDEGANWPDSKPKRSEHWSLQPLKKPEVPRGKFPNRIDAFIAALLAEKQLEMSPPADRATLIRRVTFDLLGLPPSPQEIDAFISDKSPRAYKDLIERLLASPRYGERWGRHWLDVARYTESQGFEYDRLRPNAWHYRDYVIKSFNDDKPYDQFMKEQIAGDVLEPVTTDSMLGVSLLVCGPWDQAGNSQANVTQKAITREEELEDLLAVVGQSFLGLTINCARCHSHKFDPIPHEEYFRLKSIFEGVKHGERPIATEAETKSRAQRVAALKKEIEQSRGDISRIEAQGWKRAAKKHPAVSSTQAPIPFASWSFDGRTNEMPSELHGGAKISGGRLHLPKEGAFYQTIPLSRDIREKTLEAWVSLDSLNQRGGAAISIEKADGSQFDAIVFGERQPKKWMAGSEGFTRTRDLDAPEETAAPGTLVHMAIVYRADNTVALFRNGQSYGKPYTHDSSLRTFKAGDAHIVLGRRHKGGSDPWLTGEIAEASLYDRALTAAEVAESFRAARSSIPQSEILAHLTPEESATRESALARIKQIQSDLVGIKPIPVSYIGARVQPEPTRRLKRGEVTSPQEIVSPGALSAIADLNADLGLAPDAPEAQRRRKFAEWLADPRNPLPARVMANRVWQYHFGQGLVATPSDFGAMGVRPTHPELLDYLATEFIEHAWSVKNLHRLIMTSDAYRQQSRFNEKAAAIDADAQLLWRFPPRRLEAEEIRDAMLTVSGEINHQLGGPSFRPFIIASFNSDFYELKDMIGPEFNRRTVYRINVNSGKEPLLDAFDCPDPSVKTPRRGVTTTPLQALALMNNSFVQRQAAKLAERALRETNNDLERAIDLAYQHAFGRHADKADLQLALPAAKDRGLFNVCWAILNSTEFVYVR